MGGQSKQPAAPLNNLAGRKPSAGRRFLVVFRNGLEKLHFPTVSYTQGCHGTQCQVGNRKPWEAEEGRATGRAPVPGAEKPGTARETAVTFFVEGGGGEVSGCDAAKPGSAPRREGPTR